MLAGKVALVTGSTSGIGLEVLKALAGAGANVAMHGLGDPTKLRDAASKIASDSGVKAIYSPADLKKPAEIRSLVTSTADTFGGKLDILGAKDWGGGSGLQGRTAVQHPVMQEGGSIAFHSMHIALH